MDQCYGTRPWSNPPSTQFPTDRKSTRLNSSHGYISYAVFCLKKKEALPAPASGSPARLLADVREPHCTRLGLGLRTALVHAIDDSFGEGHPIASDGLGSAVGHPPPAPARDRVQSPTRQLRLPRPPPAQVWPLADIAPAPARDHLRAQEPVLLLAVHQFRLLPPHCPGTPHKRHPLPPRPRPV